MSELIGYARVSTRDEQEASIEHQVARLKGLGIAEVNIFVERASAVGERPVLDEALRFVRRGDIFVVCRLDRLARSIKNLAQIADDLKRRNVALRILDLGIDTSTPTGDLVLNLLGSIAQFELLLMKERQKIGIDKAKKDGRYLGRKATARAKTAEVIELAKSGMRPASVAETLGISAASVYSILAGNGIRKAYIAPVAAEPAVPPVARKRSPPDKSVLPS
jgi:DNA invertase Pin-like site-specific DNA recombinase